MGAGSTANLGKQIGQQESAEKKPSNSLKLQLSSGQVSLVQFSSPFLQVQEVQGLTERVSPFLTVFLSSSSQSTVALTSSAMNDKS